MKSSISFPQGTMMKTSSLLAALAGAVFLSTASSALAAAADSCGVAQATSAFEAAATMALKYVPALDADVDKCFNQQKPAYITQTHKILSSVKGQYSQSLEQLQQASAALQSDRIADFVGEVNQIVVDITTVNKPVFAQASNLKNYGFTVSDAKINGQIRYPACNSANNDGPAQIFASFYSNVVALRQANAALSTAANCLQHSGAAAE